MARILSSTDLWVKVYVPETELGKVRLDQFKVLNQQPAGSFPQLLSTDLYPEWPFAALPDASDKLVKQVTLALMNIQPTDIAAQQGGYYGFAPVGNYAAIEAMMQRLKVKPELEHEFFLRNVSRKYAFELISTGMLVIILVLLVCGYWGYIYSKLAKMDAEFVAFFAAWLGSVTPRLANNMAT